MSGRITKAAYQQMVDENLAWLYTQARTLERDHIALIVKASVDNEYPDEDMLDIITRQGNEIAQLKARNKELTKEKMELEYTVRRADARAKSLEEDYNHILQQNYKLLTGKAK